MKSTSTALRLVPLGHLATSLHGANHLIALVKKGVPNTETFLRTLGCASGSILIFRGIGTSFSGRSVTKPQTPQALVPLKSFRDVEPLHAAIPLAPTRRARWVASLPAPPPNPPPVRSITFCRNRPENSPAPPSEQWEYFTP